MDSTKEQLWKILDDLDTLDDAARDDDDAFRRQAIKIVARRSTIPDPSVQDHSLVRDPFGRPYGTAPVWSDTMALWEMVGFVAELDTLLTLDENKNYRRRAVRVAKQRLSHAVSKDGQTLVWLNEEQS